MTENGGIFYTLLKYLMPYNAMGQTIKKKENVRIPVSAGTQTKIASRDSSDMIRASKRLLINNII